MDLVDLDSGLFGGRFGPCCGTVPMAKLGSALLGGDTFEQGSESSDGRSGSRMI